MSITIGYDPWVADFYDHVVPYRERADVAFFVDAAVDSGGPVLEVGCGTGRILIPTARAGIGIVGLDSSPHMLDVCRDRLDAEPAEVQARTRVVQADMREFDAGRTFVLVTTPFRPFQHLLTVDDQLACLSTIRRHLEPGGRLILDIFNPWIEMLANPRIGERRAEEPPFELPDGRRIVRWHRTVTINRVDQVNDVELVYDISHPDGRTERFVHAFPFRYLFRFEAEHLLARAGFEVEHLYGDYGKGPFGSADPGEMIYVARRT